MFIFFPVFLSFLFFSINHSIPAYVTDIFCFSFDFRILHFPLFAFNFCFSFSCFLHIFSFLFCPFCPHSTLSTTLFAHSVPSLPILSPPLPPAHSVSLCCLPILSPFAVLLSLPFCLLCLPFYHPISTSLSDISVQPFSSFSDIFTFSCSSS
ncbi:unnamed protein product [Acanthosepion pharaonis]|uniref:Uncharacterized protein n=1 Tax=Acanthosepion pharaonis TaxID=158019 RepID=A0A812BSZ5_ACAPH|nr:unnamed protein product [Sepia pharaonis]